VEGDDERAQRQVHQGDVKAGDLAALAQVDEELHPDTRLEQV
jgi:hypothetical protein